MGSLFNFINYNKPGPGVQKNEPPKPRVIVFFKIYSRKLWNLIKLNILFSLFNIPALLSIFVLFVVFSGIFQGLFKGETSLISSLFFPLSALFLCVPVITTGPAQAGFTYVLRNYSRQEHAFIWSDFKEHALKNFKQGLLISIIDFLVTLLVFIDISIYANSGMKSLLVSISEYIIALLFMIYLMMHLYIYPMLVTFKLSLRHIYKNAFIFAMVNLIPNAGILLLCFVLSAIPFLFFPVMSYTLFPFITLSTIGFITNFYAYPILEKYMINKE
ncbi:MAG: DUF624 domain-containing protein [Bacillota bacterium]|nr:DUF624 domain-containing protein [Bacillota bacterium]